MRSGRLLGSFAVSNVGGRIGTAVPQIYVGPKAGGWEAPRRLAGWSKVTLAPGVTAALSLTVDPRLLSVFEETSASWRTAPGSYEVRLGNSSADTALSTQVRLPACVRLERAEIPEDERELLALRHRPQGELGSRV